MNSAEYDDTELLPLTSGLQCTGFWSGRKVVVNTTDKILWDSRVTPEEAASYLYETADSAFRDYFMAMARAMLKHANAADSNRPVSHVLKGYGIRGKRLNDWARPMAPMKHGRYADFGAVLRRLIETTRDLGRFNRSSQHSIIEQTLGIGPALPQVFSSQVFCVAEYSVR